MREHSIYEAECSCGHKIEPVRAVSAIPVRAKCPQCGAVWILDWKGETVYGASVR